MHQSRAPPDGRPLLWYVAALGASDLLQQMLRQSAPRAREHLPAARAPAAGAAAQLQRGDRCHAGLTVLHFAAAHGQLGCVRLLLAHGATAETEDAHGLLASDHAMRGMPGRCMPGEGHADCHALLLRHLAR